ncbi:MAG TPA: MogA/MoaB family molybdenum cofactor biosynthesis protein [Anaerolineales bacterium]|nr:MogA/MoaB family molybdenum cofactor biosynthesis protein [Anaerolineales bacterium]
MTLRFGLLTVSDRSSQGEREDVSGPVLAELVQDQGWETALVEIVPDEVAAIADQLTTWTESGQVDVILTTGGTGFAPRDVTPEATLRVVERLTPGIVEAIRAESLKVTPHAMLSRAAAGIRGKVLIVNFPGSPKAVRENFAVIAPVLPHAVEILHNTPNSEKGHRKV